MDAPTAIDEPKLDITGLYAFKNPKNAENLVVILTTNAHQADAVVQEDLFSEDGKYAIYIDNNADLVADTSVNVYFQPGMKRYAVFVGNEPVLGADFGAEASRNGTSVFAGYSADPFFMDYEGYANFAENFCTKDGGVSGKGFRCASTGNPKNYFEKFNVGAIAIEVPIASLISETQTVSVATFKVWAKSFKLKSGRSH